MSTMPPRGPWGDWTDDGRMRDPAMILERLIRTEEMEVALYRELAAGAPTEELRMTIYGMAKEEEEQVERLKELCRHFTPRTRAVAEEEAETAFYSYGGWLEGARRARDTEEAQAIGLLHLARLTPQMHVRNMILNMVEEEVQEAIFWNIILMTYWGVYPDYYQQ